MWSAGECKTVAVVAYNAVFVKFARLTVLKTFDALNFSHGFVRNPFYAF